MKKKNLFLSVMLFFSILPMTLFTSCDKDTNCYLEVKVLGEGSINPISGQLIPGEPASGAIVEISQDSPGDLLDKGVTNGSGVYKTHFNSPAIVNIKAELDDGVSRYRGESAVRLKQGETVTVTVNLTRS